MMRNSESRETLWKNEELLGGYFRVLYKKDSFLTSWILDSYRKQAEGVFTPPTTMNMHQAYSFLFFSSRSLPNLPSVSIYFT